MYIDSQLYAKMMRSGANSLENSKERINALNVFPVPDGDTGVNMSMTMSNIRDESFPPDMSVAECAKKIAGVMLRSARGNSGVILSLFFRGVAKILEGLDKADALAMNAAFSKGVEEAYKAIQNPTEGTILTVMKACASVSVVDNDLVKLFADMTSSAEKALAMTPEMLPVLKQANVVDAGGAGFVEILKGMTSALSGNIVQLTQPAAKSGADFSSFDSEDIEFPYCTECIIEKSSEYIGEEKASAFRSFVMRAGNSAVFVDDEEIIKVHVHTKDPGSVLSEAVKYGSLRTVKVENMRLQHSKLSGIPEYEEENEETSYAEPTERYGFVAVTMGEGIKDTFVGVGVDSFVYGGQTMNPSTDQILEAIGRSAGKTVFILPNNSNICLVAKQAAELSEKRAIVIPSTSVPQGLAAMLAFDPDADEEDNEVSMNAALSGVKTLELTFAAHDSTFDGKQIKKDQLLGLVEHKVRFVCDDIESAIDNFAAYMGEPSFVTIFYGEDITEEQAEAAQNRFLEVLGSDTEVTIINGAQPLYYFVISVE